MIYNRTNTKLKGNSPLKLTPNNMVFCVGRCSQFIYQESVVLKLKPSCENCDKPLPPDSTEARICSYECTFCAECVESVLQNVCPNCGGGFCARPVRPVKELRSGTGLSFHPATEVKTFKPVDTEAHARFAKEISSIAPNKR